MRSARIFESIVASTARLLQRQPLTSGVSVAELPDERHDRKVVVNGSTVLTVDLPQGGSIALSQEYEPGGVPAFSVLRIKVLAPVGARVLLNKESYQGTMDAAADRWSIRVDQQTKSDPEAHVEGGPWIQEVTSDPPPPPKAPWTAPPAKPKPPPLKPRTDKPAEAAAPSKLDVVREHLSEERWDTDDLAAELTDADLAALSPEERVNLIAEIGTGLAVGDEDETTIDRLLETTPTAEYGAVGALLLQRPKLLQTLDDAIDGEEYKRYLTALTAILVGPRSEEELLAAIDKAPELVWTGSGFHVEKATYQVEWTKDGRIRIRRWLGLSAMQMEAPPLEVAPNDLVVVRFMYDDGDADAKAGQFRPMPAAAFVGLVNLEFKRDAWLAVNVGFLVGGVGGVVGAATRLGRLLAALDLAVNAANIGVEAYRAQIAGTQRGREFLRAWDTVQMVIAVYGIARVAMHIPQAIRNARAMWRSARGAVLESGATTAANEMEKNLTSVEKGLEDAQREAKVHPAGEEPQGAPHGDGTPAAPEDAPKSGDTPSSGEGSTAVPAPPRKLRLMHGTEQKGFESLGGLQDGKINVANAAGEHQDLSRGFYLTTDEETALEYASRRNIQRKGGGMTHVLQYDVALEDLGSVVDIRPGGRFRADWERFLDQPPFRLPGGGPVSPGLATRREFLKGAGMERRGAIFEEFLRSIDQSGADAIVGPLGDGVFTGITAGKQTTQVCIRSQAAADKLNAIMRGPAP